ncbi:MAG: FKBP-type peptidyl-prolyl cis-trans isomerase [Lachnospiraceae bacterium]|nr:FKBP-type peptidyl-prolyl cis-trans isomerase [Lachnospiraceae bacterium]
MKKKIATTVICLMAALTMITACGKKEDKKTATKGNATPAATVTPAPAAKHLSAEEAIVSLADYKTANFDEFSDEVKKAYAVNYYNNQVIRYNLYGMKGYDIDESKDTVENGDYVNIDFVGKVDGAEFEGGTGTDFNLEIGSHTFVDDFEEQLIGKKIGETVTVNVTFPEDYDKADLKGKDAEFTVTLNHISIPVEITGDNGWLYIYGADDYDSCIASLMEKEAAYDEDKYKTDCRNKYVNDIIAGTEYVDLTSEVDAIYANIYSVYSVYAANYGLTVGEFASQYGGYDGEEGFEQYFRTAAENQLKGELAFEYIANEEGITVSDEEYETYAQSTASAAGYATVAEYASGYDSQFGAGEFRRFVNAEIVKEQMFEKYATFGAQ